MKKLNKNQKGFSAVEAILIIVILALLGVTGYLVYKNHHKITTVKNTAKTSTVSNQTNTASQQPAQKYITISAWGVRVPYSGSDTFTASDQTCVENGDANGDTVNLGCQVDVNSQNLTNSVGSCQSKKATGTVGYFYRMGTNDNFSDTNGSGFTPVVQWAAQNKGQYTKISSYYYAFAEIGAAWGGQGTTSINTSTNGLGDTVPSGCNDWISEYNSVEPLVKPLASKFETIPN